MRILAKELINGGQYKIGRLSLFRENGCYHVKGFEMQGHNSPVHIAESFPTLKKAVARFLKNKIRCTLRREYLNSQGYTFGKWGQYFGNGQPLYYFNFEWNGEEYGHCIRAHNREEAKEEIQSVYSYAPLVF